MKKQEYINSVLNEVCCNIEQDYPGSIARISDNVISEEGLSYIVEVFNLSESQLLELSNRQLEFNQKYYNRLGKLLLMQLWTEQESKDYFYDKVENERIKRLYRYSYIKSINLFKQEIDIFRNTILSVSINSFIEDASIINATSNYQSSILEVYSKPFPNLDIADQYYKNSSLYYLDDKHNDIPKAA